MCAGSTGRTGRSCIAPPTPAATRAISSSAPRARSWISCAFRWAGLPRTQTRALASRFGLPVAAQAGQPGHLLRAVRRLRRVVAKLRPEASEPGEIVDQAGHVLGRHDGRRSISPSGSARVWASPAAEPLYVLQLEPETRRVVVGPRDALGARRVSLSAVNWLGPSPPAEGFEVVGQAALGPGAVARHRHARRQGRRRCRAGRARFRRGAGPGLRRL